MPTVATACHHAQEVVPGMEEAGLLADALKQLDQPFLVVVVGEFNSGKSSVINALLGGPFLAEGILPTTNEIAVLRYRCVCNPHNPQKLYQCNSGSKTEQLKVSLRVVLLNQGFG